MDLYRRKIYVTHTHIDEQNLRLIKMVAVSLVYLSIQIYIFIVSMLEIVIDSKKCSAIS